MQTEYFFEGREWLKLYKDNPDPAFIPVSLKTGDCELSIFHGKIAPGFWLNLSMPLLSIPVTFWGSPVTDIFPFICNETAMDMDRANEIIKGVIAEADKNRSWALIVKDLPVNHSLEQDLFASGFIPVEHDPIWYITVPDTVEAYLNTLSKGRKRGLEGRWKRFKQNVTVRPAVEEDLEFIWRGYTTVWDRSKMRLEMLTHDFFCASMRHPACKIFIFQKNRESFAFVMLWQRNDIWFDKYIGTDNEIYKDVSFYSMSILHLLDIAPYYGIKTYVAGQGAGEEKAGLGFKSVNVRLWIKPLLFTFAATPVIRRFMRTHNKRIYTAGLS